MGGERKDTLSIVIPTYNERANIEPLFRELIRLGDRLSAPFEVIIVDDESPDGTWEAATTLGRRYGIPVRGLLRAGTRGLGTAIVAGLQMCNSDLVCVMDGDLSHPPLLLDTMLQRLNGFDGAIASRYTGGGRVAGWSLHRKLISRVATRIAQQALNTKCADPLSGYFVFRSSSLSRIHVTGLGNKPLLEILGSGSLEFIEVPYEFRDRTAGRSKLTLRAVLEYLLLILLLGFQGTRNVAGRHGSADRSKATIREF